MSIAEVDAWMKQCSIIFSYVLPKPNELPRSLNPRADKARRFKPAFMAWLDDIVGDWNDSSGNHYQVGGWLSWENFRTCFFGICFFPVGIYFKKHNTMCVWVFFSVVFFICFFSSSCFNSWFGYLVVGFSGLFGFRFWLPRIDHRIWKTSFSGLVKKRGNPIWGTPNHRTDPNQQTITYPPDV